MAESSQLSIEQRFCHHSTCRDHGKPGHGNVRLRGWGGRDERICMAYCRTCKRSYSERKATTLKRAQAPTDEVVPALDQICEGCDLRAVDPRERSAENAKRAVREVDDRTGKKGPMLLTQRRLPAQATAIVEVYGERVLPLRKPGPGRLPGPCLSLPAGLLDATVQKKREKAVEGIRSAAFGMWCLLDRWQCRSGASDMIDTSFMERNDATDRMQNGRERRESCGSSWDKRMHDRDALRAEQLQLLLAGADAEGGGMEEDCCGVAEHVWSLREWLTYPAKSRSRVEAATERDPIPSGPTSISSIF